MADGSDKGRFDAPGGVPKFVAPGMFDEPPRVPGDRVPRSTGGRNVYRRRVVEDVAVSKGALYRVPGGSSPSRRPVDAYIAALPPRVRAHVSAQDLRHAYLTFDISPAFALGVAVESAKRRRGNAPVSDEGVAGDFGD